eukprot:6600652-Heterocapsa_arctica.AAC.1
MRRRRPSSNIRNGTETKTCKEEEDAKKETGGEGQITRINNNHEERNHNNYKKQEKRTEKDNKKDNDNSRRRYYIKGCRACGRSTETPASLLGFRSAFFDVRVLD